MSAVREEGDRTTTWWLSYMPEDLPLCEREVYRALADRPNGPHGIEIIAYAAGMSVRVTSWALAAMVHMGELERDGGVYVPTRATA